jgi:hypothetical protein
LINGVLLTPSPYKEPENLVFVTGARADDRDVPASVESGPNYDANAKVDYWLPIPPDMRDQPAWNVIGRLEPGVAVDEAESEVAVPLARQADAIPEIAGLGARIEPLLSLLNAEAARLLPLLAAAGLVLLVACGNATGLLLIRGLQRQHAHGLATAIGGGGVAIGKTMEEIRGESLASRTFAMELLIGFGAIAALLTLGGVYSVLSLSVTARQRELAIRSAIGTERGRILGLVIGQGLRLIAIGALARVVASDALSRLLQTWLFGVEPNSRAKLAQLAGDPS